MPRRTNLEILLEQTKQFLGESWEHIFQEDRRGGRSARSRGVVPRTRHGFHTRKFNKNGKEITGTGEGRLCIAQSWPGQM